VNEESDYQMKVYRYHRVKKSCFLRLTLLVFFLASSTQAQRYFEFVVPECNASQKNSFIAVTSDTAVINQVEKELALPERQRMLFITGFIDHGDGGFNTGWNWHFRPNQWMLTFNSIEVCDGCPQFVEDNLDYWVDVLGQFCPWGGRVSREVIPTMVSEYETQSNHHFLIQNYPNPFNSETIINYQLPALSTGGLTTRFVKISIYDILGQKVAILVKEKQLPGQYQIKWNASENPSGLYFCAFESGDFKKILKIISIK
jgi:hypothetical protein